MKLYLFNLGGFFFWLLFLGGLVSQDLGDIVQVWFLGYWASQYDTHPANEVSAPLCALFASPFQACLTLEQLLVYLHWDPCYRTWNVHNGIYFICNWNHQRFKSDS